MNIPFCDLEEIDGVDIASYDYVVLSHRQTASVMFGGGGFTCVALVRVLIYNSEGLLINNVILQESGRSFNMPIYSNCNNIGAPIGGSGRTNPSQFSVPEGGKVVITNIGTVHRLFGWSTVIYYRVSLLVTDCDKKTVGWIRPYGDNLALNLFSWFRYKILGSGLYGIRPNKWHSHSMQAAKTLEDVRYDFTGTQGHGWGEPVVETDLSGETELSRQRLKRLSYIYQEFPDLVTN